MTGLYVQLDVNWVNNPKLIAAGLDGRGLHATAMCLAKTLAADTDGWVHAALLRREGATDDLIDRLVGLRLLDADGDCYRPAGWLDRNRSQAAIAADRSAKAEAARAGNHARWGHPGNVDNCIKCNPRRSQQAEDPQVSRICDPSGSQRIAEPSPSLALETESETKTTLMTVGPGFDEFWAVYPKKTSKQAAQKRWAQVVKATDPAIVVAGAKRYAAEVAGTELRYVKDPQGWLSAGRWDDEPGANRRSTTGTRRLATADDHGPSGLVDPKDL